MPRPIDSREVPTDMGSFVRASIGDRIFVYAWIDILIFGYVAYLQGFSPSPVLFAEMIILAIMRIAAFFLLSLGCRSDAQQVFPHNNTYFCFASWYRPLLQAATLLDGYIQQTSDCAAAR